MTAVNGEQFLSEQSSLLRPTYPFLTLKRYAMTIHCYGATAFSGRKCAFYGAQALKGTIVRATDGDVGKVDQFYFDDQSWAVRYIVIAIGRLFGERKILFSPGGAKRIDSDGLHVGATVSQIHNSPGIDTEKPVSRVMEQELHDFYGWPYYWNFPVNYDSMGIPLYRGYNEFKGPMARIEEQLEEKWMEAKKRAEQSHLRSSGEVIGYDVSARNDIVGITEELLVDADQWVIRYLIVDLGSIVPGRKVLIASPWIQEISWETKRLFTDIAGEAIRHGPPFNPAIPIDKGFETRLFDYYEKPHYWESEAASVKDEGASPGV
jgi:hypothetical protein